MDIIELSTYILTTVGAVAVALINPIYHAFIVKYVLAVAGQFANLLVASRIKVFHADGALFSLLEVFFLGAPPEQFA